MIDHDKVANTQCYDHDKVANTQAPYSSRRMLIVIVFYIDMVAWNFRIKSDKIYNKQWLDFYFRHKATLWQRRKTFLASYSRYLLPVVIKMSFHEVMNKNRRYQNWSKLWMGGYGINTKKKL